MDEASGGARRTRRTSPRPRSALGLAAALTLLPALAPMPAVAQEELFVPHAHQNDSGLRVFPASASGNVSPVRTIAGGSSGVTFPGGVAVDPCAQEAVVTNANTAVGQVDLRVFRLADTGGVAPQRVIQGPATKLGDPHGVAIASAHDEIIVANLIGVAPITVYHRLTPGNAPPVRSLAGPNTGLAQPWGVAYDDQRDEIIVASSGNASIRVFPRTADGDAAPSRTIAGPQTGLTSQIRGVAVDPARGVIAVALLSGAVSIFARTAGGDVAPVQTLQGLVKPIGVAFSPQSGDLFVTDVPAAFPAPDGRVQVFAQTGGVYAFSRTIGGNQTGLVGPGLPAVTSVGLPPTTLVASVLPLSRSMWFGHRIATAFISVINTGSVTACQVGIAIGFEPSPMTLTFQPTDPATNQPVGTPGARVNIPPGATATFVIALTPTRPFSPGDLPFAISGINTSLAPIIRGVSMMLVSASETDVPDVIALVGTPSQDGVVRIPGPAGTAAFAVATSNVGAGDTITVSADTAGETLPVTFLICETDPATAQCLTPLEPTKILSIAAGATPTFTILAIASGAIVFDPAVRRVFVRFTGSDGLVRGLTGAALTTE